MPVPPWVSHSVMDANPGNLGELSSWAESHALGSDILVAYKHRAHCIFLSWWSRSWSLISEYLHIGIPSSWALRQSVVRLILNIWATSSHVNSELRSSSTCSLFIVNLDLPRFPVHSTRFRELIVDVTELVFTLESITRWYYFARTWSCLRDTKICSFSKVCIASSINTHSSCSIFLNEGHLRCWQHIVGKKHPHATNAEGI